MALTAAEKSKRYRERKKKVDPEAYRKDQTARKARQRQNLQKDKAKWKAYLAKEAFRKQKTGTSKSVKEPARTATVKLRLGAFTSPQAMGRCLKKATDALPKSSPQKVAVLGAIVSKLTPTKKSQIVNSARRRLADNRGRPQALNSQQKMWVTTFLERPDISYTCPGRKDQVYVGKDETGKKEYQTKRYLLWTMNEIIPLLNDAVQEEFDLDNQFTVTYGTLWRHVKTVRHINYMQDIPENTCTCDYCENLGLLLEGISRACHSNNVDVPTTPSDMMTRVLCDVQNVQCVDGLCQVCADGTEYWINLKEQILQLEEVTYHKWVAGDKYPVKAQMVSDGQEAADELDHQIQVFKRHQFNYVRQHCEMKILKQTLQENTAVVQVDFAENYANVQKDATQSSYFGRQSFSLYTACAWYRMEDRIECSSFCYVTDALDHSKYVAFHLNKRILTFLSQKLPKLDTVHFWSDGCASQFKSKFCFQLLTVYPSDLTITWNYFESHHGKGPVDGVGGRVKCSVYRHVKAGRIVINSPEEFAQYADKSIDGIHVKYVSEGAINEDIQIHSLTDAPVTDIPGTRKVHHVQRKYIANHESEVTLQFFYNSQFQSDLESQDNPFRIQLYPNPFQIDSISDDGPSSDQDLEMHDIVTSVTAQHSPLLLLKSVADVKENEFVCTMYGGKWWLSTVLNTSVENEDVEVSFLHPSGPRTTFHWPTGTPDTCWIECKDILGKLLPDACPSFTGTRNLCITNTVMNAIDELYQQAQ